MTQENQGTSSAVPDNLPVKRKRGRPRKDRTETQGQASATPTPDTEKKNQRMKVDLVTDKKIEMVGQAVSGVLDGSFDAGYLLTVRVGDTDTVLKGIVFQPGSSVPISGSNDVAPHVKMLKRAEIHTPQVDVSTPVHNVSSCQSIRMSKKPDEPRASLPVNQLPIVPPQYTEGVENDTKHDPQPESNTVDNAEEDKSKKIVNEFAQGHTGGAHQVLPPAGPADADVDQGRLVVPVVHSKSNSSAKHDQTVNQEVMLRETEALARSEAGNGVDPKTEPSTKMMVDKLPVTVLQENQTDPRGEIFAGEYSSEAGPAAELHNNNNTGTYLFSSSLPTEAGDVILKEGAHVKWQE